MVLSAHRAEDVTQEGLRRVLAQMAPTTPPPVRKMPPTRDTQELVVSGGVLGGGKMPMGIGTG